MENFKKDFDWNLVTNKVNNILRDDFSTVVKRQLTQMVTTMISELVTICCSEGSSMSIFLSGKATALTQVQQAILQSNIIKSVQSGFAIIAEIQINDLFELNVKMGVMELEMQRLGDLAFANQTMIKNNSCRIDAQ